MYNFNWSCVCPGATTFNVAWNPFCTGPIVVSESLRWLIVIVTTTGLHDSQVQYWEPAKWVAKLRTMKTDDNQLFLFTNMDAGHGGASGRFNRLKEVALQYAFMMDILGIRE